MHEPASKATPRHRQLDASAEPARFVAFGSRVFDLQPIVPLYVAGALSVALNLMLLPLALDTMLGGAYADRGGKLTLTNVAGVVLFVCALCGGMAAQGLTLVFLSTSRRAIGEAAASLIAAAHAGANGVGFGVVWVRCLRPDDAFLEEPAPVDLLRLTLGGMLAAGCALMGVAAALCAASYWCVWHAPSPHEAAYGPGGCAAGVDTDDADGLGGEHAAVQPNGLWRYNRRGIGLGLLVSGAVALASCVLPPVWNEAPVAYYKYVSPQAWGAHDPLRIHLGPDVPSDSPFESPVITVKPYPDVIVFFGCVGLAALIGCAGAASVGVRRLLHARPRWLVKTVAILPSWVSGDAAGAGLSVGELALWSLATAYGVYFTHYWLYTFPRMYDDSVTMGDPFPRVQAAARFLGHAGTLCMALTTLPITRNSVWEAVFGVPFERALRVHRAMGRATWFTVTMHMLSWQIKWAAEDRSFGLLARNVVTLSELRVTGACPGGNCAAAPGLHDDNWTIPVAEAAWVLLSVILLIATVARRWHYELFHYTHHASWVFLLVGVLHAWSHWYYTATGIILYALDKVRERVCVGVKCTGASTSHTAAASAFIARHSGRCNDSRSDVVFFDSHT